ncbi:tetraacyldisaccharide 4'-kinase, partial [Shewanella sp. 125m-7]
INVDNINVDNINVDNINVDNINVDNSKVVEQQMLLEPSKWLPVSSQHDASLPPSQSQPLVAMAGIGNPQRFFDTLTEQGYQIELSQAFDDHSTYSESTLNELANGRLLVMTEKDAVKCREFAKDNWWYLAVDAKLSPSFDKQLLAKIDRLVADK